MTAEPARPGALESWEELWEQAVEAGRCPLCALGVSHAANGCLLERDE